MGCCGEKTPGRLTIRQEEIEGGLMLRLEYAGGRTVKIKGPATGATYVFSGLQRVQAVDPRDAAAILRDRHFRLKGVTHRPDAETLKHED